LLYSFVLLLLLQFLLGLLALLEMSFQYTFVWCLFSTNVHLVCRVLFLYC